MQDRTDGSAAGCHNAAEEASQVPSDDAGAEGHADGAGREDWVRRQLATAPPATQRQLEVTCPVLGLR
jgi:hypothetical protein